MERGKYKVLAHFIIMLTVFIITTNMFIDSVHNLLEDFTYKTVVKTLTILLTQAIVLVFLSINLRRIPRKESKRKRITKS